MTEKKELTEEEQQAAIDKVLGEPIFDGFTENVYRIRRNLLAFAVLSLVVTLNNLTINETNLPVKGLSNQGLYVSLFLITAYHFAHFITYVRQYWSQWRIRLTAKRLVYKTSNVGAYGTYQDSTEEGVTTPKQATLYSWWLNNKNEFNPRNDYELHNGLKAGKIEERLTRFDDKFWKFQRQQHLNWIIFEVSIPILTAIAALTLLLSRFCGY